jgi:hypothetical protein
MADIADCPVASSPADDHRTIFVRRVPDAERPAFLPRVFGPRLASKGEAAVFDWMAALCPAYSGGYWQFYDLSNGGFYLALDAKVSAGGEAPELLLRAENGFEDEMSYDAAGIVATMYAINRLIWQGADHLEDAFYKLRAFAAEHAEFRKILRAVD